MDNTSSQSLAQPDASQAGQPHRVAVFREARFNAAHRLFRPDWSDEQNQAVFGLCNNPNWHGHNYKLIVRVIGPIDPQTGYVMDLKVLKDLIAAEVTDRFDHKNLNLDVPDFADLNPTAENIVVVIYQRLRAALDPSLDLHVRLYETDRNFVEYPAG
jgi:6-pyruvoyltetrahydropterin/6-carboxytetrahydropterin synthase